MTITFKEFHREYQRDPDTRARALDLALEEGDPQDLRLTLVDLARVQDALYGSNIEPRLERLLPKSGDLTLVLLCKAAQLLGLQLRVATEAEQEARQAALAQGKMARLPQNPLLTMDPEDILWDRDLYSKPVALAYLTACLRKCDEVLMQKALRGVIACHRGRVHALAKRLQLQREAIFEMLTGEGYPKVTGILQILRGLGYVLLAEAPREAASKRTAAARAAPKARAEPEQAAVALAE